MTASTAKSEASGNPDRIAFGYEIREHRIRLKTLGVRPQGTEDIEEVRDEHEGQRDPERLTEPVERGGREKRDGADRPEQERAVQPQQRQLSDAESRGLAGERRSEERTRDKAGDRDTDEQRSRDSERHDEASSRDRPREQDLQRSALPLARDREGREPDSDDQDEGDRDRVDEPQRDRTRQAEQVAATELGELLELGRDRATREDVLDDRAVGVVDDRQERSPDDERRGHDGDPPDVRMPDMGEDARFMRARRSDR